MTKVLIVEDDKAISTALSARLRANGFEVCEAYDAATAAIVARKNQPDIAVLDISMPAGDGFVVAERLRRIEDSIPLIFITASHKPGLRSRARALGAFGFFEKPYDSAELLASIGAATA